MTEARRQEYIPHPFAIKAIDHVVLRVTNLEAAPRFYAEVLGGTLEKVQQQIGLYQVRAGQSLFDLVPISGKLGALGGAAPGPEGRNVDHFCLRVEPFDGDAIRQHLASKGFAAGKVESRYGADGQGPSIYVTDPDGNVVELKGPPWESGGA